MPSPNQPNTRRTADFDTSETKFLATKNDLTLAAVIRGIRTPDRCDDYIRAELELADDHDRDPRKEIIAACNRKKAALEDRDGGARAVDVDTTDDTDDEDDGDTAAHGAR